MDFQHLIDIVLAGLTATLGWFGRTLYGAVESLKSDLAEHKVIVARDYATNDDLRDINSKLDELLRYVRK